MNCSDFTKTRSQWLIFAVVCVLLALSFSAVNASQFSALGVSPTRIVIDAHQKNGSITITNNSKTDVTYRMKLLEMGRDSKGIFRRMSSEELPVNHQSAAKLIRFSPRQVQLKPGQSQVIRVIARRPRNLAAGEYRSHLQIAALPVISDQNLADLVDGQTVLVQAKSGTNVGISMPVILRHGQTKANVRLKSVQLHADKKDKIVSATVDLGLEGNQSTYGHIKLQLASRGKWQDIGLIRGFALYPPYSGDQVRVPVNSGTLASQITANSKVRVIFENPAASLDKDSYWLDGVVVPQTRMIGQ